MPDAAITSVPLDMPSIQGAPVDAPPQAVDDRLAALLAESAALRVGQDVQHRFRRPAQPHPERGRHRSEEHTSELQSRQYLVCRLLLEKKTQPLNTPLNIQKSNLRLLHN